MRLRICILAVLTLVSSVALAQIDRGAIVGTVTDQSGAVISGATIKVTNHATNVVVSTTTNSDGQYQVLALNPGVYTVQATAKGMKPAEYPNFEIHVQSRPALDFHLSVGNVAETLVVSAEAPPLQTQSADMGGVVNEKTINDLPLNGRVYAQLALLEAGAGKYYSGPNETPDRFSMNGNSEMQNYFALDGVDNNSGSTNQQDNSMQVVQPPPDAIQEFKVQTRTYSAEFGTAAGGVINVSTKSGSNQLHGSLWEFIRNDKLAANTFFNNLYGMKRGDYKWNQYGATFGGPILRDHTFFFLDFQGYNTRKANTQLNTVPTPLMKNNYDFSELSYALNPVVPSQAGCITNNVISANCIDPVAKKMLALYPDPNVPSAVAKEGQPGSFGGGNYVYSATTPNDTYSGDARIDHNVNAKNHISGRFSMSNSIQNDPMWTSNPLIGSSNWASENSIRGASANISWTDTISNSVLNEARFGFNRMRDNKVAKGVGGPAEAEFGITGLPITSFSTGLPPIDIWGIQGMGVSRWRPQRQVSSVYQFMDNLSWLKGRHSYKFGYQYYRSNSSFLDIMAPQGYFGAEGIYTNNNNFGLPDFLLGDMAFAQYTTPLVPHTFRPGHAFYGQDEWRMNNKLTLSYGIRYELFAPLMEHDNYVSDFSPANGGQMIAAESPASSWYGRSLIRPDRTNFAPRVGFAYNMVKNLVVRGGYGVFYQHNYRFGSESVTSLNPPFVNDARLSQNTGSTTPVFYLSQGFPGSELTSATVPLSTLQIRAQDPKQRTSYVEQTSFGLQYEVSPSTVASVDYVGNFGRKMARIRNLNQGQITDAGVVFPYANLNTADGQHAFLEYETHDGNLNYNAMQASLRRKMSKGLAYGISYTWSHGMADYNTPINGSFVAQNAYDMGAERGNSSLDVRHRLAANALWQLPIGKGGWILNNDSLASRMIGGWQVNTIVTVQTGNPFTITAPDETATGNHDSRANCVGSAFGGSTSDPRKSLGGMSGYYINPSAFAVPAVGEFGSCSPYSVHGPGYSTVDLSIFKSFQITESKRIEIRSEFFNAFNHANFSNPNSYIGDPGSFGKFYGTVGDPREIQFALKLYF